MPTALITGASSGIGEALMHEFARNGHDIIAVAENEEELAATTDRHRQMHPVSIRAIAKDLARPEAPQELYDDLKRDGIRIDVLVNNAGVGFRAPLAETPMEKIVEIIRLDIEAVAKLTRLFLPDMLARDEGYVLNLGSVAGFQPAALMATYHGAKAFVVSFTESIIEELKDTNVTVTCLAPGPVDTNFFKRARMEDANVVQWGMPMDPAKVAQEAYEGLMRGEHVVMPGMMNKVMTFTRRVMSKEMQTKLQKQFYESSEG